jgi:hypothetical protein
LTKSARPRHNDRVKMFISRNGEQIGSWTEEEVRHYFQAGQLVATDHYWRPGMTEWDLLGGLLMPPIPTAPLSPPPAPRMPPVPSMPPVVPNGSVRPPVPSLPVAASSRPSSDQTDEEPSNSWPAWFVPIALAFIFGIFLGPSVPRENAAWNAGASTANIVIFLVIAFPVSLLFRRSWRLGARCGIVAFCGLLLWGARLTEHKASDQFLAETSRFAAEQKKSEQEQIARTGHAEVDQQKIDSELQKLQNMSQGAGSQNQKLINLAVGMMKEVVARRKACVAAEQPVLELGMGPSKLTSVDEIDRRRTAVQTAQQSVHDFVVYVQNLDVTTHDSFVANGISSADADAYVKGLEASGKIRELKNYWGQEDTICGDLLAILDLLKKNWGNWHSEDENVAFGDKSVLADYRALVEKLQSDTAAQKAAQAQAVGTSK